MNDESTFGVSFVSLPGMEAVEVIDPIERHRYRLAADRDLEPDSIDTEPFLFPVDRAINVTVDSLTLPSVVAMFVRKRNGQIIAEAEGVDKLNLKADSYVIELCTPIKIYLEMESSINVESEGDQMDIRFGETVSVDIGARSAHERPEATITTTADPRDMMETVSAFGSALKTTSPERSFPTLRGHPPRVELGDQLDIPKEIAPPQTEITIELTPTYETIFPIAPLAYYLGASVVPGEENRILVGGETLAELGTGNQFSTRIEEILKQAFLLDCVTRTEGLYPVNLDERERLESRVDVDFEELYQMPAGDRIQRYLDIPYVMVSDLVPRWGVGAHMIPDPSRIEVLPYLVDDMALIHVHDPMAVERPSNPTSVTSPLDNIMNGFTRSAGSTTSTDQSYVKPPQTESIDQVWVGDGTPIGASKAIPQAFENRLNRTPTTADIDITVVCNETSMADEEGLLNDIYGSREDMAFDVTIKRGLTTAELESTLQERTDFLHYIGHIDEIGVECTDGKFDLAGVDEVGVDSFLLNACQSYIQGRHLIENGSIGGIVTLSDVINEEAVRMGKSLARFLNFGFPLYAALGIARTESLMGTRYTIVGDGRVTLSQPKSVPHLLSLKSGGSKTEFEYQTFPTSRVDMGSFTWPRQMAESRRFLVSQRISTLDPDFEELREFLQIEDMPVRLDGELQWSSEIPEELLRSRYN